MILFALALIFVIAGIAVVGKGTIDGARVSRYGAGLILWGLVLLFVDSITIVPARHIAVQTNDLLAQANNDPGVLYQNCLAMVERLTRDGKVLPAAFTCGAGPLAVVPVK